MAKFRRGDHDEAASKTPKLIEQRHAMADASRQPLEAVDEDLIDAAAANESQQPLQPGAVERCPGKTVVIEALHQKRSAVFTLR